jgi:Icc-related predicted phosphoesterase
MNIQFASDLHLEFKENSYYIKDHPLIPVGDILILAGDIACFGDDYSNHPFWDWASENFNQVLVVPGNHEFYKGYDLSLFKNGASGSIRKNVNWYYNQSIFIGTVQFILTTLWSLILPDNADQINEFAGDFQHIIFEGTQLTVELYNKENQSCIDFLQKELQSKANFQKIVVSHHAPIMDVIKEPLKSSWYKSLYANELSQILQQNNISYWIYGHSHQNVSELMVNKTKLVCNQLGYVQRKEYHSFDCTNYFSI